MRLVDVNDALGTNRPHYEFHLSSGHSIIGRSSGIAPTNNLVVILQDIQRPPSTVTLRTLIDIDEIIAISEL